MSVKTPNKIDVVFENVEFISTSDILFFEMNDLKEFHFKDSVGQEGTMLLTDYAKVTFKISTVDSSELFGNNLTPEYILDRLQFKDACCFDLHYDGQSTTTYVNLPWDENDEYSNLKEEIELDKENDTMTLIFNRN